MQISIDDTTIKMMISPDKTLLLIIVQDPFKFALWKRGSGATFVICQIIKTLSVSTDMIDVHNHAELNYLTNV